MTEATRNQIAALRKRWDDEKQRAREQQEADERDLWRRLRAALLQSERPFLSPCTCDEFLANTFEGRKPQCAHFDGVGLIHELSKQHF